MMRNWIKCLSFGSLFALTTAGGCDQEPCLNGGTCYDIGESGYECICDAYAGRNCQLAPPTVMCESSRISVAIDRLWLMAKVNSDNQRHVYMGSGQIDNEGCKATISESDPTKLEVALENNFRQCGTEVSRAENGDFVYKNTVFLSLQDAGIQMGVAAIVQWTCEYEDQYTVSSDAINPVKKPRDDRAKVRSIIGAFDLNLRPFTKPTNFNVNNLMTSYVTEGSDQAFHVIPTEQKWLSFQAAIMGDALARGTRVSLKKCFISASRSPFHDTDRFVDLVQDGCGTDHGATHVYTTGQKNVAEFATNIRKFRERWMESKPFYFHCQTQLCPIGEECPIGCSQDQSDRSGGFQGDPLMVHTSSGPYFFQGSQSLRERSSNVNRATLLEEDAEHSYGAEQLLANPNQSTNAEPGTIKEEKPKTIPLVGGLASVTLLAILVIVGFITIYNRRATERQLKSKRTGNKFNINFAHEGSLRATKQTAGFQTAIVGNQKGFQLPGTRPAGHRPNYV